MGGDLRSERLERLAAEVSSRGWSVELQEELAQEWGCSTATVRRYRRTMLAEGTWPEEPPEPEPPAPPPLPPWTPPPGAPPRFAHQAIGAHLPLEERRSLFLESLVDARNGMDSDGAVATMFRLESRLLGLEEPPPLQEQDPDPLPVDLAEHRHQVLQGIRRTRAAAERKGSFVAVATLLRLEVDMLARIDGAETPSPFDGVPDQDLLHQLSTIVAGLPAPLRSSLLIQLQMAAPAGHG